MFRRVLLREGVLIHCILCPVTEFFGREYPCRRKIMNKMVHEIRQDNVKKILFIDDNILCNRAYARDFFKTITPIKLLGVEQVHLR